jgi:hypothetical protein
VEERSTLRRPSFETTNSLSVFDRIRSILGSSLAVAIGFSRHSGSRASLSWFVRRCVPRARSLTPDPRPSRMTRKSYGPRVPDRTMVANLTRCCFAGFGTDRLRRKQAMKTAGRENLNARANVPSSRALCADGQNRPCSFKWAAKQEKHQPLQWCFFLTSPFIELTRHLNQNLDKPVFAKTP